jgi:uncharacterized membrane protein
MNQAHFHLMVNHLPIIFPIVGVLVLVSGMIIRSEITLRIAYLIFIAGALTAVPSMITGEEAEDQMETVLGEDSEVYMERHEESAEAFATTGYVLALLSVIGLWASAKDRHWRFAPVVILVIALATLFLGSKTGTSGGEIRHTEIRVEN